MAVCVAEIDRLRRDVLARVIHEAKHGWRPPLLSCMTKHREQARRILARLEGADHAD